MKKKIFLALALVMMLVCALAISVSADTIYKTESGDELFRYVDETSDGKFESYQGSFAKTDNDGNELTWYILSTTTSDSNKIITVASKITLGEAGSIDANGEFTFTSPVTNQNTVSVNFPDNEGIKKVPAFGGYGSRSKNNILFAYMPNTLTEIPESLFQETFVIVGEFDDETPVTTIPHKVCHEARNIEAFNVPASVTFINSIDANNGVPFYRTYSLKSFTFAPNSQLTRISPYAFQESGIEEIQFPASLEYVNQNLFRGCSSLRVLRFGENFKSFENVDRFGKVSTVHHSVTHTATGIKEIYLPASFYATKPDTNYRVSYAFDGGYNVKYFYTGTKEQLEQAKANFINTEWTTGATGNDSNNWKFLNATAISWETYKADKEAYESGYYVIYDYNVCDAFHKGEHFEDTNPCVVNCDRCKTYGVAKANPKHNEETSIVYTSFSIEGLKITACTNEGCKYSVEEEAVPLFTCLGYSIPDDGRDGLVISFTLDQEAIDEYTSLTGKTFKFGAFAAAESKIGNNDVVTANGQVAENTISADITDYGVAAFDLVVLGFSEEYRDIGMAMGAYVIDGDTVSYMQAGKPEENEKYYFASYNEVLELVSSK